MRGRQCMKILLTTLNSKYVHSNLALKYLYAVAQPWASHVELKEYTINNTSDYVFGELIRGDYDVICFSCYIWNIRQICDLAENIKRARPNTIIALGGPEVSFETEAFLTEHPWADFILMGEGEEVFRQWMEQLFSGEPNFGGIDGLAWRDREAVAGEVRVNPPAKILPMDKIPFPYEYVPAEEDKVLYYESSRGCPFRCAYCLSSVDKTVRTMPLDRVKRDLSYFIYKKVKQVKFIDRTFNFDPERSKEIFRYLIERDNGVTNFHFEICGDLIDDEMLEILKTARKGLFQFEIGVQSTNRQVLKLCGRGGDFGKLSWTVKAIRDMKNIHLHLDLIAGLPGEDFRSFRTSFNDVYRLKPDALQLGFLKVLKGSPMMDMAEEFGIVWRHQAPYETLFTNDMGTDDLVHLKMVEEILDLYWNRGGFSHTINFMTDVEFDEPFAFYDAFATYYFGEGHHHKSHKKEDLYRILHAFGATLDDGDAEEDVRALLKKDMAETLNPEAIKKFEKKGWELS